MSVIKTKHVSDTDKYIRHYTKQGGMNKGLSSITHNYVGKLGDISTPGSIKPVGVVDTHDIHKEPIDQDLSYAQLHLDNLITRKRKKKDSLKKTSNKKKKKKSTVPKKTVSLKKTVSKSASKGFTGVEKRKNTKNSSTRKRLPDIL